MATNSPLTASGWCAAPEFLLRGQSQVARGGAGGDDERIAGVAAGVAAQLERPHAKIHELDVIVRDIGREALGVTPHALHERRSLQSLDIARPVVDVGGGHELPALLDAGDQERRAIGARSVHRRAVAGGTRAENDEAAVPGWGHETPGGSKPRCMVASPIMAAVYLKENHGIG